MRIARSTTIQPSGSIRASPTAAANTSTYMTVRFASSHDSSGTADQRIEKATSAASPANRTSVTPPCNVPPPLRSSASATSRPQTRTVAISVHVVGSSWNPPAAPNEIAASAAPSSALAAEDA
jgi:hypothetical protein